MVLCNLATLQRVSLGEGPQVGAQLSQAGWPP